MRFIVPSVLVMVGILHLLPLAGVLGTGRLHALYGVRVDDPNLEILLRHRAVLFGLLGAFLIGSAVFRQGYGVALGVGGVSVVSFLALSFGVGSYNTSLSRVVVADIVAAIALGVAFVVYVRLRPA